MASKGELIAIYRLEFYKNKKKWKFCKNERALKKDVPSKKKLNETYRVEVDPPDVDPPELDPPEVDPPELDPPEVDLPEVDLPEVDPPEPLNDAFMETDSDENLKEDPKPKVLPPVRSWRNTLLDLDLLVRERDWAIPDVKAEHWEPTVEPVRSYEDECGWDGEVYASELCLPTQRSRLPVFSNWPQPPDQHMLRNLVQNLAGEGMGRRRDEIRQMDGVGMLGQSSGQLGQSVGQMGQNVGQLGQNIQQLGQCDRDVEYNVGKMGQTFVQVGHNVVPLGQNIKHYSQNDVYTRNIGNIAQTFGQNKSLGQNTGYLGQNMTWAGQNFGHPKCATNQNEYIEPEISKQNLYQNSKGFEIQDMGQKVIDFDQLEWVPERDCCELGVEDVGGVCGGDACVAGAAAALAEAEGWLTGSLQDFYLQPALSATGGDMSPSLSCDSDMFARGAHSRPHSSELELAADTPCECANMSANKLAHMSGAALRDALRAYTIAAQRIVDELRARSLQTNIQPPCAPSRDVTHESLPTRDTAPRATESGTRPHVPPGRGRGRRLLT